MGTLRIRSTLKAELQARGIECRPSPSYGCKELFRAGVSLGHFTAPAATDQFIR